MQMQTKSHRAGKRGLITTLVVTLIAALWAPLAHGEGEPLIIDKGHVDAFNVYVDDKGALRLNLKEDVTGSHVPRDPSTVELHVKSRAEQELPEGVPGAPKAHYLPSTQDHDLVWPGWDTLGAQGSGFDKLIKLHFDDVEGPGEIHMFQSGTFGGMTPVLASGEMQLGAGDVIEQPYFAHVHVNWTFTKPGVYKITAHASGSKDGSTHQSEPVTYTFTVGDQFRGQGTPKPAPTPEPTEGPTSEPEPTEEPTGEPSNEPTQEPTSKPEPTDEPTDEPSSEATTDPVPSVDPTSDPAPSDVPTQKPSAEPAQPPAEEPSQEPTATPVDEDSQHAKPTPVQPQPKAPAGASSAKSSKKTPSKKRPAVVDDCKATQLERAATPDEVRAAKAKLTAGKRKVSGSATVPANTHVHPNWVFSAPGTYKVTIRQSTTSKSGASLSDTATLKFNVGGTSGATNGHFDFGSQIVDGKLRAMVKDDRQSPATWVSPSSLAFGLGSAAKVQAPAGLEFVADEGQPVWMIASSQVSGVPWLGANTMHESLMAGSTGNVKFELVSVEGPGNVGVFTSGNFGKIVDQVWFSSKQAPASKESPAKLPQGMFLKGDKHMVKETKWQRADGSACKPKKGVPRTGVNA